jgi:selT/selW/selH-like putative selenoprotein
VFTNVQIRGEQTDEVTGWLEVKVNGKLVHSKKDGMGHVDTDEKLENILQAVKRAGGEVRAV